MFILLTIFLLSQSVTVTYTMEKNTMEEEFSSDPESDVSHEQHNQIEENKGQSEPNNASYSQAAQNLSENIMKYYNSVNKDEKKLEIDKELIESYIVKNQNNLEILHSLEESLQYFVDSMPVLPPKSTANNDPHYLSLGKNHKDEVIFVLTLDTDKV